VLRVKSGRVTYTCQVPVRPVELSLQCRFIPSPDGVGSTSTTCWFLDRSATIRGGTGEGAGGCAGLTCGSWDVLPFGPRVHACRWPVPGRRYRRTGFRDRYLPDGPAGRGGSGGAALAGPSSGGGSWPRPTGPASPDLPHRVRAAYGAHPPPGAAPGGAGHSVPVGRRAGGAPCRWGAVPVGSVSRSPRRRPGPPRARRRGSRRGTCPPARGTRASPRRRTRPPRPRRTPRRAVRRSR
jgi:hypothetical protein